MATGLSDADDPLFRVTAYHRRKDGFMEMRSPLQEESSAYRPRISGRAASSLQGIVELDNEPLWLRNGGIPTSHNYSSWAPNAETAEGRRIRRMRIMA